MNDTGTSKLHTGDEVASMQRRARLAWPLLGLATLLGAVEVFLGTVNHPGALFDNLLSAVILLIFAAMGALIESRRPRNPAGWLLSLVALLTLTSEVILDYAYYGLIVRPGAVPAAVWVVPLGATLRGVGWYYMLTLVPLTFPDGKLLSPRWRWCVWLTVVATALTIIPNTFSQFGDSSDLELASVPNPLAIMPSSVSDAISGLTSLLLFAMIVLSMCSVVLRFRRARGAEREQLKWFVFATAIGLLGGLILFGLTWFSTDLNPSGSIWLVVTVGMPIATCVAILRYRLYDIDIIIKRTLLYALLTIILAALYFGLVIGAQRLTQAFSGQRVGQQPVVIVLSTLLIAALFTPVRARLQGWIDRRFYRSRYDAAKTLAAFSATLRSEVDLAQLNEQLLGVVEQTMRPAHASLWLRAASAARQTSVESPASR
ncbi:MAG: hypothetical protein ACRDID_00125 [Ktedonobacterales bacterium]